MEDAAVDPRPHEGRRSTALAAESPLARELVTEPGAFEFFQAVRLLERLRPDRAAIGRHADPADEAIRFATHVSFGFPASAIESVEDSGEGPVRMTVNFAGLVGAAGVLPLVYTSLLAERLRAKDGTLRDFLDLFHHRLISLFYRAWEKHRPAVSFQMGRSDRFARVLTDLIGLGTEGLAGRLPVPDDALLSYAGLLGLPTRPAIALESLLADYFDVPVRVEQFVGGWYPLEDTTLCRLGDESSMQAPLGLGAVVGDEVWDQQSRVRVRIGPLTREQYDRFLPGGEAHEPLRGLVRFFNDEIEVEAQLVLARDDVRGLSLGTDDPAASQPLGWSTWLCSRERVRDGEETVLAL